MATALTPAPAAGHRPVTGWVAGCGRHRSTTAGFSLMSSFGLWLMLPAESHKSSMWCAQ